MTTLVEVERLTIAFGARPVVEELSLSVDAGEIVALVGESGSGKTLTARALMGLLPEGAAATGIARFAGEDLLALDTAAIERVRGARIGLIFQEPMSSLDPTMTIGEQMVEGLRTHAGVATAEARRRAAAMLARVRVADPDGALDRYPHHFSGGMRQRISIAAAMLLEPELLIADEPTTALDVLVQKEVLDLIVALARESGMGVLLVTHDLGLVAEYADRVVVMRHGRLVEQGPAAMVLGRPQEDYTRRLLAAVPKRDARDTVARPGDVLLRIENLDVRYAVAGAGLWRRASTVTAVRGASLTLRRGETLAIVGESGSGKTTLMRAVLRLVDIAEGRIRLDEADVGTLSGRALTAYRRRVRIVMQDPQSALDPRMRVAAIVAEGLRHDGLSATERRARVTAILSDVGLGGDIADRFPHQLSGGQRQRVNIARALVSDPELVIADEPVSALDVTVQAEVLRLLARLQARRGFACLFVSHALGVVEQIADRVAVIHRGRIVEEGDRDAVFDDPRHPYTLALLRAAPRIEGDADAGYALTRYSVEDRPAPPGRSYFPWTDHPSEARAELIDVAPGHRVAVIEEEMS